jgi:hypothetical protein
MIDSDRAERFSPFRLGSGWPGPAPSPDCHARASPLAELRRPCHSRRAAPGPVNSRAFRREAVCRTRDRIGARPGAWSSPTCAYARRGLASKRWSPVWPHLLTTLRTAGAGGVGSPDELPYVLRCTLTPQYYARRSAAALAQWADIGPRTGLQRGFQLAANAGTGPGSPAANSAATGSSQRTVSASESSPRVSTWPMAKPGRSSS